MFSLVIKPPGQACSFQVGPEPPAGTQVRTVPVFQVAILFDHVMYVVLAQVHTSRYPSEVWQKAITSDPYFPGAPLVAGQRWPAVQRARSRAGPPLSEKCATHGFLYTHLYTFQPVLSNLPTLSLNPTFT